MSAACRRQADSKASPAARPTSDIESPRRWVDRALDAGDADHGARGHPSRLLRAVRARTRPDHQRPEGQAGRHPGARLEPAHVPCGHGGHVGLDPAQRHRLDRQPDGQAAGAVRRRKVDAFLGFPPEPQELRARKIGHVILNSATDQPWSQYFCCMLAGNTRVRPQIIPSPPSAYCAPFSRPPTSAPPSRSGPRRRLVDAGFTTTIRLCATDADRTAVRRWREFDPEDTIRFYALRLHEVDMIKSSPNEIIAKGTDWRFLNELKRELKA